MTNDQKKEVSRLANLYMGRQTQTYIYHWGKDYDGEALFNSWCKEMKKLNIDFNKLSETDAYLLGLCKMNLGSSFELYAVPLHIFTIMPEGTKLYNLFNGEEKMVGRDNINDDTRGGYVAYGVKVE